MGDPNEGDFVGPAVGIPKGFETLKAMLRSPPTADKKSGRALSTLELRKLLVRMSKDNRA
jgi:hypothetical protein